MTVWKRGRRSGIKYRQHSERCIDGYRLTADVDEFGVRWTVAGRMAGYYASVHGDATPATLEAAEARADQVLPLAVKEGLQPDPIWKGRS